MSRPEVGHRHQVPKAFAVLSGSGARHAKPRRHVLGGARDVEHLAELGFIGWDAATDLARRTGARVSGRLRMTFAFSWPSRRSAAGWLPMILFITSLTLIITAAIYRWLTDESVVFLLAASAMLTVAAILLLEAKAASREKACRQGAPLKLIAGADWVPAVLAEQVQENSAAVADLLRTRQMWESAFRQMCEIAGISIDDDGTGDSSPGKGHPRLRVIPGGPAA